MKNKALQYYIGNDFSVIPLRNDKRAAFPWEQYQKEKADEAQITKWWTSNPNFCIGIVTGPISGITVVDLDHGKPDGKVTPLETFPETFTVKTPSGGYHLYYQFSDCVHTSTNIFPQYPHTDIRNVGGYVVAGGSVTDYIDKGQKAGGLYEIIKDIAIAPFPTELFAPAHAVSSEGPIKKKKKLTELMGVVEGQGGNNAMTSLVGKLVSKWPESEWDNEVWPVICEVNKTYKPPFTDKELLTIYESITKKEKKRQEGEEEPENEEEGKIVTQYKNNKTKGTYLLAMYIVKKYNIVTIGEIEKEVYIYQNGVYRRAENEIIYPEVQRILKNLVNKSSKLETMHKICDATYKNRDIFATVPLNFIPLANGVYDIDTNKLLEHSPSYYFKCQFPVKYDKNAQCPKSIKFLQQVLDDEQFLILQEWIGYYFYRNYMFKKAIILVGEGDTGKTTLLEMITHLLGRDNISSVSLQKMASDKFAGAHMYEKHGNLVDELSAKDISDSGSFKVATGGGSISGEYKFGNQFSFLNYSKLTFACNKIPTVKDFDDVAYFNRWMIIRFTRTIAKKIPNFIQTLTTEEERSGLFNFAIDGLKRLMDQGKFSYNKNAEDTKLEMMKNGSSIAQFISEKIVQEDNAEISKEDMYDIYAKFCRDNELQTETMDAFGKKFMFYISYASEGLMTEHAGGFKTKRVRAWRNVGVVKDPTTVVEDGGSLSDFDLKI